MHFGKNSPSIPFTMFSFLSIINSHLCIDKILGGSNLNVVVHFNCIQILFDWGFTTYQSACVLRETLAQESKCNQCALVFCTVL